jgi:RND family efflux transporter MFP subunit
MRHAVILFSALAALAACKEETGPVSEPIRPVRVVVAQSEAGGETETLTGDIRAMETVGLGFRTGGRVLTRLVDVGDTVEGGQLIAQLEDTTQRNAIAAAQAELFAAEGDADRAKADYDRNAQLLERGFNTRQRYDIALQTFRQAQARVDAALAGLSNAEEALAFTALYADASGVVTAIGAEPGEVVSAGAVIVRIARDNGRDAVFNVPQRLVQAADPTAPVEVALVSDSTVTTTGLVREVAPEADPVTRTFQVRVGLSEVPAAFRLGSAVTGTINLGGLAATPLPASALTTSEGEPAVFVVDPDTGIVDLRQVEIARFDISRVWVTEGVLDGDAVVTAGVQTLRPGQQVRLGEGL